MLPNDILGLPFDWTYIILVPVLALTVVIVYLFFLKPRVEYPLPNEEDCGIWKVLLTQLGMIPEGRVTTARRHYQKLWAKVIDNSEGDKADLVTTREAMLKYHLFAQKTSHEKIMYFFDQNPRDAQFHTREDKPGRFGSDQQMLFVHGVKDCVSIGKSDGWEYIGVKLSKEGSSLLEAERKNFDTFLTIGRHLRLAAENIGVLHFLKDKVKVLDDLLMGEREKHAETRSKLDRALSALEQKPLSTTGEAKLPGGFGEKLKGWFTWPQLAGALAGYLSSGPIMQWLESTQGWSITPPMTTYVTLMITIAGFFSIPAFRKLFGRWL